MTPITKAVVPVAGWATRFLPAVKTYAKHLIPVVDRPQLQWVIEELLGAGITDFCIVHREDDTTIKDYFQPNPLLEQYLADTGKSDKLDSWRRMMDRIKHIEFLPQTKDFPYGNGTPLLVARNFIGQDPVIYLWGDDLTIEDTPGSFVTKLIQTYNQYQPQALIGVQQIPDWQIPSMGILKFKDDPNYPLRVDSMVEKPKLEDAPSNYGQGARFIVSPKIIEILENTAIDRGELWLTNAFNTAAQDGVIMGLDYQASGSQWSACGDPLTWLKANITLALKDPKYSQQLHEFIRTIQ